MQNQGTVVDKLLHTHELIDGSSLDLSYGNPSVIAPNPLWISFESFECKKKSTILEVSGKGNAA